MAYWGPGAAPIRNVDEHSRGIDGDGAGIRPAATSRRPRARATRPRLSCIATRRCCSIRDVRYLPKDRLRETGAPIPPRRLRGQGGQRPICADRVCETLLPRYSRRRHMARGSTARDWDRPAATSAAMAGRAIRAIVYCETVPPPSRRRRTARGIDGDGLGSRSRCDRGGGHRRERSTRGYRVLRDAVAAGIRRVANLPAGSTADETGLVPAATARLRA